MQQKQFATHLKSTSHGSAGDDTLIYFGSAVKALGNGRVGGYLVLFGDANQPDLVGDFFTKQTDFDLERSTKATVLYDHGLDDSLKRRKLGLVECKVDDVGVWVEGQLALRDEYEQSIYEMAQAGKLGWSSGTASHLVERKQVGNAYQILTWPLGLDASLTPTPAEPRTLAVSLKSYLAERTPPENKPALKGLFDLELAKEARLKTWDLRCALDRVFEQIAMAARTANVTGQMPDVQALVAEAVASYDARLIPAVVAQINEFAESKDEHFWLKTASTLGALVSGTPLLDHSEAMVTAVEEFAHQSAALKSALSAYVQRAKDKQEFRIKAGRVLSQSNRDRMDAACTKIKDAMTAMQGCHDDLSTLLAAAMPKSADNDEDDMKKSLDEIGALFAGFLQLESRLIAAGV